MHKKIPLLWEVRGWCWGTHRRVSTPNPSSCFSAQSSPYQHSPQGTNPVPAGHPEEMLINLPPPAQVLRRRLETAPPPTFLTVCKGRPPPRPMKFSPPLNSGTCYPPLHPVIMTAGVTEVPAGPRCLPRSLPEPALSHWSQPTCDVEAGHGSRLHAGVGAASGRLCCSWVILMRLAGAHGWSHLFCGSAPALGSPLNTPRWASTLMPVSASGAQTETTRPHRPPSLELWEVLPPPFCARQRLGLCRTDRICILLLCPETGVVGSS